MGAPFRHLTRALHWACGVYAWKVSIEPKQQLHNDAIAIKISSLRSHRSILHPTNMSVVHVGCHPQFPMAIFAKSQHSSDRVMKLQWTSF